MKRRAVSESLDEKGRKIEDSRRRYDTLYDIITSRARVTRLAAVAGLKAYYEAEYAEELTDVNDTAFHDEFARFFAATQRNDRVGNILQMFAVYFSLLLSKNFMCHFCPPPPDPEEQALDEALVDREAFTIFLTKFLLPAYEDVHNGLDGGGVNTFCKKMTAYYTFLLPGDTDMAAIYSNRKIKKI